MRTTAREQRRLAAALSALGLFLVVFYTADLGGGTVAPSSSRRGLARERPVMHTFFAQLDHSGKFSAGMTDAGHRSLVEEWKSAWSDAGFEPKVLGVEDARLHPEYDKYEALLKTLVQEGNEYDNMCFLRWFAMAAAGGGWMSDYDAFPLEIDPSDYDDEEDGLPNGGEFFGHSLYVPSLVSGSAEEWDRMAHALVEAVSEPDFDEFVSDMLAMLYLREKRPDTYSSEAAVHEGNLYQKPGVVACWLMKGKKAIHFSHSNMLKEATRLNMTSNPHDAVKMRHKIARDFMDDYRAQCKPESSRVDANRGEEETRRNLFLAPVNMKREEETRRNLFLTRRDS